MEQAKKRSITGTLLSWVKAILFLCGLALVSASFVESGNSKNDPGGLLLASKMNESGKKKERPCGKPTPIQLSYHDDEIMMMLCIDPQVLQ